MSMEVWLQKHDFSTDSLSEKSREECLGILESFDWDRELAHYEGALEEGRNRCPPGMGFVRDGRTLHVMPIHEGKSHYHYSCDHPVRLFALFGATRTLNVWAIPDAHRRELVALHYDGNEEELVRALLRLDGGTTS